MDLQYLRKILKIFNESDVEEIKIEEEGLKLKIKKTQHFNVDVPLINSNLQQQIQSVQKSVATENFINRQDSNSDDLSSENQKESSYYQIKSPIVGTFYRSPSPDAEAYVKVGDRISPGTVLCIVEAMKLMNEIECDVDGKIVKILGENGKPVEYGQVLFLIEKS